jgi:hypothetical protein
MIPNEIGVQVSDGSAHFVCVLLIHAEDDGFCETIRFLEKVAQVPGYCFCPGPQCDGTLKIFGFVLFVGNPPAVTVEFAFGWTPTCRVPFGNDTMHAVRSEKAVFDALPPAVLVEWVAEISVGISVSSRSGVAVMPS